MDILKFTPEHEDFRKRLRAFCEAHIIPFVDQWEKDGIVPRDIWRRFGRAGFLCPDVAPEYGGLGGDFRYAVIVSEELSRTRHTGLAANLHSDVVVPYIVSFGSEAIKATYLPGCVSGDIVTAVAMTEPGAGSDLAGMCTTATDDGDTVVLNGAKTFISNAIHADVAVVAARDADAENPYQGLSLFTVPTDTPGFKRGRQLKKMGWHSQDTAELFFTDCRIPADHRLGEKGMGFMMLMEKLQQERLICAVGAVTGAEVILQWATEYLKKTVVNGRPMAKHQAVQFALVEMATDVKIGRTYVDTLVADHVAGGQIVIETSMAKYWTTDMVQRVADRALDLCAPYASLEACPLVRAWRDVRVMSIFAGTNEIMKGIVAKFMGL